MVEIGKINRLQVAKEVDFGVYLDAEHLDLILLPARYVPENCEIDQWLDVFIYMDSEDRLVATTDTPLVMVGQCAYLKVVDTSRFGAFLDWGLPKDLLVPFAQQEKPMELGKSYVVYLYLDEYTDRIVASSKLDKRLSAVSENFKTKQSVDLLIFGETELGYKAVINQTHTGLIFKNEVFTPLQVGQRTKGYIKNIRADHKIDLSLQIGGSDSHDSLATKIVDYIKSQGGQSQITDKSPPEVIYQQFGVSKSAFKRAVGSLYKQGVIKIEKSQITLALGA